MADANGDSKPDFTAGFRFQDLPDGVPVPGRASGDDVILVRRGDELFAVGASCTHYHGPLADGLVVGDTVRCPWHHACFSLRTGEALRAPALDPIACWRVERSRRHGLRPRKAAAAPRNGPRARERHQPRSSSSAVAPPVWPPRTCCAAKATTGR